MLDLTLIFAFLFNVRFMIGLKLDRGVGKISQIKCIWHENIESYFVLIVSYKSLLRNLPCTYEVLRYCTRIKVNSKGGLPEMFPERVRA